MKIEIFLMYVANGVDGGIDSNQIKKKPGFFLFVDGHKTYLTIELSEFHANNEFFMHYLSILLI